MATAFRRIWTSGTAYGGNSYSATSNGEIVNIRRGPFRDSGHVVIAWVTTAEWEDMIDMNGEPCFFEIERLAETGSRFASEDE